MSTLRIKDLHVSVETAEGPKEILKGVNLTINSGEIHAIMGPNGSGKSTMAYALAGHPDYEITSGEAWLDDQLITEMSVDERAKLHLDGDGLHVERLGDSLGDLHVIAVGISARDVLDGDRSVGFGRLLPVVGSVCGFHADTQGFAVAEFADGFLGGAGSRGTRVGAGGLCCRAAAGKERCTRNGECGDAAEFEEIAA